MNRLFQLLAACVLLVAGGSAAQAAPPQLQDLEGKRIAILSGTAGDLAARRQFPDAQFVELTTTSDAALAVDTGKADAFVFDKSVLINLAAKNPQLRIVEQPVGRLDVAVAMRKDNAALQAEIDGVLAALKQEGELQRLRAKWVDSRYTTPPPMPSFDQTGRRGVLRMGTSAENEPFSFHARGELAGLDIELIHLIGQRLDKRIEIVDLHFDTLIPALQSKKIDVALANFNVTEERKKLIRYSTPYLDNDISALVRAQAPAAGAENDGLPRWFRSVADSFHSNIILEDRYLLIWDGLKTTVIISVFSTLLGTLLGGVICFMRMSARRLLKVPARIYIAILRGTPVLVLLMLIFYVVFASIHIDPVLVAIIAFGMNFAAYSAEIFRTGIEGVDKGQTEAGIALGFTRVSTFVNVVLPQTIHRILPVFKGEFISLVKMTSVVGYIAVQDLTKASDIIRSRTFDAFFPLVMIAILYFLISWVLLQSLGYLERVTDPKYGRKAGGS
ncbi:ABC transporter substrate-binding protein/permease [Rhodocyclus purpureus]|uniref:ABC transporter substrate-binding protein/permease n=1 Tax=Rhodocyclus purpureus TaxID=1067 RepID=UPI00191126A7|nr:ABC transporter substrate-binding protein/permease [Rhodocyclus purpureus]MBK5914204.1 hypothetical protein [Rhodocyclus purpureus]